MTFGAVILLLPLVLSIHNLDEYTHHPEFARWQRSPLPERFATRRVFAWAAMLLTLTVAIVSLLTYRYEYPLLRSIWIVSMFALAWNALGHCALSAARRSLLPGTRSAGALVLPYAGIAIFALHVSLAIPFRTLLEYAGLGALALPLAAGLFASMGYAVSRAVLRPVSPMT